MERSARGGMIAGSDAFRLYDTYGLPLDFLEELAEERGLRVDKPGFEGELLEAQRERARQSSKMGAVSGDPIYMALLERGRTAFLGYDDASWSTTPASWPSSRTEPSRQAAGCRRDG